MELSLRVSTGFCRFASEHSTCGREVTYAGYALGAAIWVLDRSSVASADLSRPVGNRRCSPYVRGEPCIDESEDVSNEHPTQNHIHHSRHHADRHRTRMVAEPAKNARS